MILISWRLCTVFSNIRIVYIFYQLLIQKGSDWLSDDDQIKWYDQKQDLSGIHIWSKPFTRSDKDGQEVNIICKGNYICGPF